MKARGLFAAGVIVATSLACRAILGIEDWPTDGGFGDGGGDAASTYTSLSDTSNWAVFDLAVFPGAPQGYAGGVFDGRYVYLAPSYNPNIKNNFGIVLQYDTQGPSLSSSQSWNSFDATQLGTNARGFKGATFDGRYVYFIPNSTSPALVTRYDTTGSFGDSSAWSTFDVATANADGGRDWGGTFDGKYMYMAPQKNTAVMRYDTTAPFTTTGLWSSFDTNDLQTNVSFQGALYDGKHVYLAPYNGRIVRYDPTRTFTAPTAWETFDTTTVDFRAYGFFGMAFDGQYVYFVPDNNGVDANFGFDGLVLRYDTQSSFTSTSSYSVFDMTQLSSNAVEYNGAAFDGRYVYFVPSTVVGQITLTRYDTTQNFTDIGSWEALPLSQISSTANYMQGAIFDGQYLYFVPAGNGKLLRFRATTTKVNPVNHGSFY